MSISLPITTSLERLFSTLSPQLKSQTAVFGFLGALESRLIGEGSADEPQLTLLALSEKDWSSLLTKWEEDFAPTDKVRRGVHQFVNSLTNDQTRSAVIAYQLALTETDCSPSTRRNYRSDISQFCQFVRSESLDGLLTKPKLSDFLEYQQRKGLSEASIRRKKICLTGFANWLAELGWFESEIATDSGVGKLFEPMLISDATRASQIRASVESEAAGHKKSGGSGVSGDDSAGGGGSASGGSSSGGLKGWLPRGVFGKKAPKTEVKASEETKVKKRPSLPSRPSLASGGDLPSLPGKSDSFATKKSTERRFRYAPSNTLLLIFNFGLLVFFLLGLGWFGWQQLRLEAPGVAAYPSELVRPSRTLSFQGRLTNTAQTPISGNVDMRFRLYDNLTGPSLVWDSGNCTANADQDGIFTIGLGGGGTNCGPDTLSDVFSENPALYLEVEVATEVLSPRQPIRTVAYAINAETLQGFPPADPAVSSSVLVLDENGNLNIGSTSPTITSTSGTFTLTGEALRFETVDDGDISLSPDGLGGVIVENNAGASRALIIEAAASQTANLTEWVDELGAPLSVVDATGNIGIGTSAPAYALDVNRVDGGGISARFLGRVRGADAVNADEFATLGQISPNLLPSGSSGQTLRHDGSGWVANSLLYNDGTRIGIGTTAPTSGFEVNTETLFRDDVVFNNVNSRLTGNGNTIYLGTGSGLTFQTYTSSTTLTFNIGNKRQMIIGGSSLAPTSGESNQVSLNNTFDPTSGSAAVNYLNVNPVINQTGTAVGTSRGIYVNPTLTSAPDWRAIEVVNGDSLFGTSSGNVGIGTASPSRLLDVAGSARIGTTANSSLIVNNASYTNGAFAVDPISGQDRVARLGGLEILSGTSGASFTGQGIRTNGTNSTFEFFARSDGGAVDTDPAYYFRTGSGSPVRLSILRGGSVGIGTTSPSQRLDVTGAIRLGAAGANNVLNTSAAGGAPTGSLYWGNRELIDSTNIGSFGVSSVTGTANQITASPTSGAVVLSLPSDLRAPGTFNAVTSIATGAGAGTVRLDASGNLTNIGTISSTYLTTSTNVVNLAGASTALQMNGVETITSGRLARLATGTAAAPTYSFTDNNNMGMFRVANNELGFATVGTERMKIDSVGRVLIGNYSGSAMHRLQLGNGDNLGLRPTANNESVGIMVNRSDASQLIGSLQFTQVGNNGSNTVLQNFRGSGGWDGQYAFTSGVVDDPTGYPNQNTHFSINTTSTSPNTSAVTYIGLGSNALNERPSLYAEAGAVLAATRGNVGIGTTNALGALDVRGTTFLEGVTTIGGTVTPINSSPDSVLRIPAQGTEGEHRVYIDLQGVFANDSANEDGGAFMKFRTSTAAGFGPEIGGIRRPGGAGDMLFKTGGNDVQERMRITDAGNVGIGTTSPAERLDVNGNIQTSGDLRMALGSNIRFGGQLGISKASGGKMSIYAGTGSGNAGGIDLNYWNGSTYVPGGIYLNNNGNVGIGTTSPSAQLQTHASATTTVGQIIRGHAGQTADLQQWQNSAGSVLARVTANGSLSLGTVSNPPAHTLLRINDTLTDLTAGDKRLAHIVRTIDTTAGASSATSQGMYIFTSTSGGNNATTMEGFRSYARHNGTGTISTVFGSRFFADNNASGNVSNLYGTQSNITSGGTGTTTNAYGSVVNSSVAAGGTISNLFGIRVRTPLNSGTLTNAYGLYIDNMNAAASSNYSIYTRAGNVVFNANNDANTRVGIGTTSPSQALDVTGAIRLGAAGANNVLNTTAAGGAPTGSLYWGNRELIDSTTIGNFGVTSVTNSDGTLSISPTTGAVVASLNLANANTWTGAQTFTADTNFPSGIWNTSGNVGIGTTSPNKRLTVSVTNDTDGILIHRNSTSGTPSLMFSASGSSTNIGAKIQHIGNGGNSNGHLAFFTKGDGSSGDTSLERLRITDQGNVGIGTTTPGSKLEIEGNNRSIHLNTDTVAGWSGIWLGSNTLTPTANNYNLLSNGLDTIINRPSSGSIHLREGNSTQFTLASGGNVGIGTTNPIEKLEVTGTIRAGATTSTNGVDYLYGNYGSGKLAVLGSLYSSGSTFLGFGVKANNGSGNYLSSTGITAGRSAIQLNSGSVSLLTGASQLSTDGGAVSISERMRITDTGNVGIGTTTPGTRLDVNGTFRTNDAVTLSGLSADTQTTAVMINGSGNLSTRALGDLAFDSSLAFTDLTDTPANYTGSGEYLVRVNAATNGLEFVDASTVGGVTSVTGTTNQITASPTTGAVTLSLPTDLRAPGTFNAVTSIATGAGAGTVRLDASGNLTNIGTIASTYLATSTDAVNLVGASTAFQMNGVETITSGRLARLATGTAAAPAYSFTDNNNMGMFRAAANTLAFSTAGTERLRIGATGNIGVGTATPASKFDINYLSGDTIGSIFRVANQGTTLFEVTPTQITSALPHEFTSSGDVTMAYDLLFTNPSLSTIKSAANLNIEAGTPAGSSFLTLRSFNNGSIVLDAGGTSSGGGTILFEDSSVKSALNTSPIAFSLTNTDINSFRTHFTNESVIGAINEAYVAATTGGGIWTLNNPNLYPSSTAYNLALGATDALGYKLRVVGTTQMTGALSLTNLNAGGLVKASATTGELVLATAGTDYENPLTFTNGLTRTTNSVALGGTLTGATDIALGGNNLTFSGTGNVGIGTTTPSSRLDVRDSRSDSPSDIYNIRSILDLSGTPTTTRAYDLRTNVNTTSGTLTNVQGQFVQLSVAGNANVTSMRNYTAWGTKAGSGTVSNWELYSADNPSLTAGAITNLYGLRIADLTAGTNNWSIHTGSAPSYFGGNVGIGTTTTDSKFSIVGTNSGQPLVYFNETGAQELIQMQVGGNDRFRVDNSGYTHSQRFVDLANSNYYLDPAATGTSLTVAGNVGIGTTNPSYRLHVLGGDAFIANGTSSGKINIGDTFNFIEAVQYQPLQVRGYNGVSIRRFNNNEVARFGISDSSNDSYFTGNLGIGTTTPSSRLDVRDSRSDSPSDIYNIRSILDLSGTPTTTRAYDLRTNVNTTSGTLTNVQGQFVQLSVAGNANVTSMRNYTAWGTKAGSGTVSNWELYSADNPSLTAGAITNLYGLRIADLTAGTNNWSIHTGSAPSYFGGNVGIGTTNALGALDVRGTTFLEGVTTIGGTVTPINSSPDSVLRIPAQGTEGEHRVYIDLQGVFANDSANEDGGAFMKFRTSTAAGFGPEIGGIRRPGGAGDMLFKTGGNDVQERMRITNAGNVGIGTTSPGAKLDVVGNILARGNSTDSTFSGPGQIALKRSNSNPYLSFHSDGGTRQAYIQSQTSNLVISNEQSGSIRLGTNSTTRQLISSSGTRISHSAHTVNSNNYTLELRSPNTGNHNNEVSLRFHQSNQYWAQIRVRSGGNFHFTDGNSGSYQQINASAFNIGSDARLKENVKNFNSALDVIGNLRPVDYNSKDGGAYQIGFIAQEVQEILPSVVSYDSGTTMLSLDYAKFAPIAIKGIQEQQAQINNLQTNQLNLNTQLSSLQNTVASHTTKLQQLEGLETLKISDAGSLTLTKNATTGQYQVATPQSNLLTTAIGAGEAVIGQLRAGLVQTQELIANLNIQTPELRTDLIRPLGGSDVTIQLGERLEVNQPSALRLENAAGQEVARIDDQGNTSLLGSLLVADELDVEGDMRAGRDLEVGSQLRTADLEVGRDATVAGALRAQSARIAQLESNLAEFAEVRAQTASFVDASVSGTLYAATIDGFQDRVASAMEEPTLLEKLFPESSAWSHERLMEIGDATASAQLADLQLDASTRADSLRLTFEELNLTSEDLALTAEAAYITQYFQVNGTAFVAQNLGLGGSLIADGELVLGGNASIRGGATIANSLAVGESIFASGSITAGGTTVVGDGYIAYLPAVTAALDPEADPFDKPRFEIQPSGKGMLSLMAGILAIDESGQVMIRGNLNIAGNLTVEETLLTDMLSPTDFTNPLQIKLATTSAELGGDATGSGQVAGATTDPEVLKSRFEIVDERGVPVATISADGRAAFTSGLEIGAEYEATVAGQPIITNRTTGVATVKEGELGITIYSEKITEDSLVYVTPLGPVDNQVLFVKDKVANNPDTEQIEGRVVVGFQNPSTRDVRFNWWIVN